MLATTTSTENSGLLDELIPPFEEKYGVRVDVVSVGTGKAIRIAENGDADIILVHARKAEEAFVKAGYGVNRRDVMYNDFVILGPKSDPARIKDMKDAAKAFTKIAKAENQFISRADDSGTHKKELSIWNTAGLEPSGSWYIETGQGMGSSLNMANQKKAYIMADRGTYLAYRGDLDLKILVEEDSQLYLFNKRVRYNIGLPLQLRGVSTDKINKKVENLAEELSITHLLKKHSGELSGGGTSESFYCSFSNYRA